MGQIDDLEVVGMKVERVIGEGDTTILFDECYCPFLYSTKGYPVVVGKREEEGGRGGRREEKAITSLSLFSVLR